MAQFAFLALLMELTPGPNMAYLAALALAQGAKAGFSAVFGVAAGLLAYGLMAAFGLSAIIETFPLAYEALRWAGVAYMFWLSWEAWRGEDPSPGVKPRAPPGDRTLFWRGFTVNMLNPKAAIFYLAVLPQFVDAAAGRALAQNLTLVAVYVGVASAVHIAIILASSALSPWLARAAERETWVRRALAIALAGVAAWLLYSTHR